MADRKGECTVKSIRNHLLRSSPETRLRHYLDMVDEEGAAFADEVFNGLPGWVPLTEKMMAACDRYRRQSRR